MPTITTPPPILFSCPRCQEELTAPAERGGKRFQCSECKNLIIVPQPIVLPNLVVDPDVDAGSSPRRRPAGTPAAPLRVVLVDVDVPVAAMVRELLKWVAASVAVGFIIAVPIGLVGLILSPLWTMGPK
jgi:hypothetical protein